jgi:hypothetical protein
VTAKQLVRERLPHWSEHDAEIALRAVEEGSEERQAARRRAHEHLRQIATGEDDGYDFAITAQLHAERR